jgi:metallo-beta-lactamase class B
MRSFVLFLFAVTLFGQPAKWFGPQEPFHVMDNIYYIGTEDLGSYLITTPEGHIVINSLYERLVPRLKANVEKLGFRFENVKIVLGGHAHGDHMEGNVLIREMSGAQVMAMAEDVPMLKTMGRKGRPHTVDRELKDGDTVELGGTTLTAIRTPGHTKGTTTWTMKATENGKAYDMVFIGGMNMNAGEVLVGNKQYPEIVHDYEETWAKMRRLPVDVFLATHGTMFQMLKKHRLLASRKPGDANLFIDPKGFRYYMDKMERQFRERLALQQRAMQERAAH